MSIGKIFSDVANKVKDVVSKATENLQEKSSDKSVFDNTNSDTKQSSDSSALSSKENQEYLEEYQRAEDSSKEIKNYDSVDDIPQGEIGRVGKWIHYKRTDEQIAEGKMYELLQSDDPAEQEQGREMQRAQYQAMVDSAHEICDKVKNGEDISDDELHTVYRYLTQHGLPLNLLTHKDMTESEKAKLLDYIRDNDLFNE